MKLKGLAKTVSMLLAMQEDINDRINVLAEDVDDPRAEEKDELLNDVYMELEEAIASIRQIEGMKLEHYL